MRRFAILTLGALAAASFAFAQPAQTKPAAKGAAKPLRIGYSQCNRGEPWREQMDKDIKAAAAAHPEIKLAARDAQNEVQRQIGHVQEFVASKVDVIIISPKDTLLTKAVAD